MRLYLVMISLLVWGSCGVLAWERFEGATLVADPRNDGDSFKVDLGDREVRVRLYFVDCPESSGTSPYQRRRMREQAYYWGLETVDQVMENGLNAKQFTHDLLQSGAFTVYTLFVPTPGNVKDRRYYSMITLADGRDLGTLLVAEGFARVHGVVRETPDGVGGGPFTTLLEDIEASAMLKRNGIWADTNPDLLADLRALSRKQHEDEVEQHAVYAVLLREGINPNHADQSTLEALPGVGESLSRQILKHRPYSDLQDMLRVPGIGPSTLDRMRPHLVFSTDS